MPTSTLPGVRSAAASAARRFDIDELVYAEQIGLLHTRALVAQLTVFVNAAIVTAVFWRISSRAASLAWLAALCSVALARALAVRAYRSRARSPAEAPTWARIFVAGAMLNGIGWGTAALIFHAPGSPAYDVLVAFVVGGMAAGAASSNASHAPAFAAFAVPALLPITASFAAARDPIHEAMAVMLALFGVAVASISRSGGRAIENAIRLRLRNEALVASLTAAQERLESLNVGLEQRVAERTAELERMLKLRLESEGRLARFRALLDQVGDAILVARVEDLSIVDVNDGACELLGGTPAELVGQHLDEVGVVPSLEGGAARELAASLRPGEVRRFEECRVRAHRSPLALEVSLAVRDVEEERYLLVAARDVSARKDMENKLAQAGLLASVGSLAAGVAHEINNPLAYILANLQHLTASIGERSALSPTEKDALQEVVRESLEGARRARAIVRDLSSLSPREPAELEPVDVCAVLESCINVAMGEIRHRATLVRELADVPPVLGDRTRLAQVFLNLLVNAAQAVPDGHAGSHRIIVRTRFDGSEGMVHVDVADTGAGIPPEHMRRIFEPFFTTKPVGRGTGLGLSICHGIVMALGGRIGVKSSEGEGSTFTVTLRATSSGEHPTRPAAADEVSDVERRARLLVIDDDPRVARALRRALVQEDVTIAVGGEAGIAALEKDRFDVVLCDIMMPEVTGMDVHRRLGELSPGAERAIVFVTGGTFTRAAHDFLESVPNERLHKPFEVGEVRAAVRRVLALRRR